VKLLAYDIPLYLPSILLGYLRNTAGEFFPVDIHSFWKLNSVKKVLQFFAKKHEFFLEGYAMAFSRNVFPFRVLMEY